MRARSVSTVFTLPPRDAKAGMASDKAAASAAAGQIALTSGFERVEELKLREFTSIRSLHLRLKPMSLTAFHRCWVGWSRGGWDALRLDFDPLCPGSGECLVGPKFIIQFGLDLCASPIDAIVLDGDGGVGE